MSVVHSYVPIVKGKSNDLKAIAQLSGAARLRIKPLIELTELNPELKASDALRKFVDALNKTLPVGSEYIDLHILSPEMKVGRVKAHTYAFDALIASGRLFTPTYGLDFRDDAMWGDLRRIVSMLNQGFCFRVDADDLEDQSESTWAEIISRTAELRLTPRDVDVLIDLKYIGASDTNEALENLIEFLFMRPKTFSPRTITLAGSSALKDVGSIERDGHSAITRHELTLWVRLQAELSGDLDITYGDYGVIHPYFIQGVANPNIQGKIRYTHRDSIHYFRGSALFKGERFEQYRKLSRRVMKSGFYQGRDFSVGDAYINDCVSGDVGTGNLGTWVRVDQNHHFEYTVAQIARLVKEIPSVRTAAQAESLIAEG